MGSERENASGPALEAREAATPVVEPAAPAQPGYGLALHRKIQRRREQRPSVGAASHEASDADPYEAEADAAATAVVSGGSAAGLVSHGSVPGVSRKAEGTPLALTTTAAIATSLSGSRPVIIEDGDASAAPGQIRKAEFFAKLEPAVKAAVSAQLGLFWSAASCPFIARYIAIYSVRPARDTEGFIRRYTGSQATDPDQLIRELCVRVGAGVKTWRETGKPPADLANADPGAASTASVAATPGGAPPAADKHDGPPVQKKADGEPEHDAAGPAGILAQLGEGEPLDGATAARMGAAFGATFSDVRIHIDAAGGKLAREQSAHAFAVGNHVAFAPGKYAPGTVEGDALLAHELAHVLQQRGASTAPAQKKSESGETGDAAELDADRGAAAAVAQLHGGATTSSKIEPSLTSDFKLQRCDGEHKLPPPKQVYSQDTTFDGDPFTIKVSTSDNNKVQNLLVNVEYAGSDDKDNRPIQFFFQQIQVDQVLAPTITPDQAPNWSKLSIDAYGDASVVGVLSHSSKMLDGWNPKSREHQFILTENGQVNSFPGLTVIKSRDAMPANAAQPVASPGVTDDAPLRVDIAAITTKQRLDDLLGDKRNNLDASRAPWVTLKAKVDSDAAKYTGPVDDGHQEAARLTRLGEAILRTAPQFTALGAATNKDSYLPDIAEEAVNLILGVQESYAVGVQTAWDGPAAGPLAKADAEFNAVWYRISGLYMQSGKGAQGLLFSATENGQSVAAMRNSSGRNQSPYQNLDMQIGVPGAIHPLAGPDGQQQMQARLAQWEQVKNAFLRGDKGVMTLVVKEVQSAQAVAGLAALLSTIEMFHIYKAALTGAFAWMFDKTPGLTNYSKIVAERLGKFETIASNVDGQLAAGKRLDDIGGGAITQFQAACGADFGEVCENISSRIKHVEAAKALVKILVIVGASALSGGAAGAAVGGFMEGAVGAGLVADGAAFVAEVVTFTMVSRAGNVAAFGGNQTSLTEDLITNALMFGFLKAASAGYARVFKSLATTNKAMFKVGGALTGMVGLQVFAEIHNKIKTGKMMGWDERITGIFSNAVMMTCMGLGESLVKGKGSEIRDKMFVFGAKTSSIGRDALLKHIGELSGRLEAAKADGGKDMDKLIALLKEIEGVWNEQIKVLADSAKDAPKDMKEQAAKAYQDSVAEMVKEIAKLDLQLAAAGIDLDLGAGQSSHFFRPMSPGMIAYKAEGLEVIRDYYDQNHGTFEPVKDKPGLFKGRDATGEIFFVADDVANSFIDRPVAKAPTEAEAKQNRAAAERAKQQNVERGKQLRKLLVIEDGHVVHKFGRVINGTGLAAAMDANTLPGAARGEKPPAIESLPETIGLGTGADTFTKLGDTPIGQSAPELSGGGGWAQGATPGDMTATHGDYTSAANIANATALTQYRSGVPILDGAVSEISITPDGTWKVPDAKVRIKTKLADGTDVYIYTDATDIATGLGPPRDLKAGQVNADPAKEAQYKPTLEADKRLVYGDQVGVQRGGKVLVSGGSATGAWNATVARKLGATVDWISPDTASKAAPRSADALTKYKEIQDQLNAGTIDPAAAAKQMADLRAFDNAALPRNVQSADAAMNDAGINRGVKEIASLTPTEALGEPPGRVRVTFTDGTSDTYDQVVASHGTNPAATGPVTGAQSLVRGMEFRPIVVDGQVVALESVNPPGAVRVVGAAMWSRAWIDGGFIADPGSAAIYQKALNEQALGAPRDSPALPLVYNVNKQIPAANAPLGGGPDTGGVKGGEVYGENKAATDPTKLADPASNPLREVKLTADGVRKGAEATAGKKYAGNAKCAADPASISENGATLLLEVPTGTTAAIVNIKLEVRPSGDLTSASTHGGDAGPGRLTLVRASDGKWTARLEVSATVKAEDLPFIIDHELNEAAGLVLKYPGGEPAGGFRGDMEAGVMTANPAKDAKPTVHDTAAAREVVDLYNDWQRLEAAKSPDAAHRKGVLDHALTASGLDNTEGLAAKQKLLEENGAPKDLVDRAAKGPWKTDVKNFNAPVNHGEWTGTKADSGWISDRPEVVAVVGLGPDGRANPIIFRKGVPDFTPWKKGEYDVDGLKGQNTKDKSDMKKIRLRLAELKGLAKGGSETARVNAALDWFRDNKLAPHHAGGSKIELIPKDLHANVPHTDTAEYD